MRAMHWMGVSGWRNCGASLQYGCTPTLKSAREDRSCIVLCGIGCLLCQKRNTKTFIMADLLTTFSPGSERSTSTSSARALESPGTAMLTDLLGASIFGWRRVDGGC